MLPIEKRIRADLSLNDFIMLHNVYLTDVQYKAGVWGMHFNSSELKGFGDQHVVFYRSVINCSALTGFAAMFVIYCHTELHF